jgi:hypothetical protein
MRRFVADPLRQHRLVPIGPTIQAARVNSGKINLRADLAIAVLAAF